MRTAVQKVLRPHALPSVDVHGAHAAASRCATDAAKRCSFEYPTLCLCLVSVPRHRCDLIALSSTTRVKHHGQHHASHHDTPRRSRSAELGSSNRGRGRVRRSSKGVRSGTCACNSRDAYTSLSWRRARQAAKSHRFRPWAKVDEAPGPRAH